ncbi:MAG: hypothetical protein NC826_05030 [Candidatus Omnitrophica bacterium]|nr:hypothetical protein [Candidatus Omnitrophota bacterium]
MFIRRNKRAQTTAEYAIVIGLVIAAAIGIQALIKEGIHKRVASEVGKLQDTESGTGTFSVSATSDTSREGTESYTTEKGGATTKAIVGEEHIHREINEGYSF